MRHLISAAVVAVVIVTGLLAVEWSMSPEAEAAFRAWHVYQDPTMPPGYYSDTLSRRFVADVVTFRTLEPTSRLATSARRATRWWTEVIRTRTPGQASAFRFVETDAGDDTAMLTFIRASSIPVPPEYGGGTIPVGCGFSVEYVSGGTDIDRGEIYSNPNKSGCDGEKIMLHEVGHFLSTAGHPALGVMSKSCYGCPSWNVRLTPEQQVSDPRWEGVPGLFEMVAWVHSRPAGSLPE